MNQFWVGADPGGVDNFGLALGNVLGGVFRLLVDVLRHMIEILGRFFARLQFRPKPRTSNCNAIIQTTNYKRLVRRRRLSQIVHGRELRYADLSVPKLQWRVGLG